MQGTCTRFDVNKGYGEIRGEDGLNYFVHFSSIQSTDISLDPGENVTFEPADGAVGVKGKMATLVRRV
jgi:CspA family cold shock protein